VGLVLSIGPLSNQLTLPGMSARGSLRDALRWYIDRCTDGCSPNYLEKRGEETRWLCDFFGADCPVGEIGYERLTEYVTAGRARGLAPTTIQTRLDLLRIALKEAQRRGLIAELPPWPRIRDTRPKKEHRAPSLREYEAVRPWIPAHHLDWYDCAYWTGMRGRDVSGTRRYHLDMERGEWVRRSTKTKARPEVFPMPARWLELLERSLEMRPRAEHERVCGLWTNPARDIGRASLAAGVPRFIGTDMRRGCRARLISEGVPTQMLQLWMCHSESIAYRHYDSVTEDLREQMRAKVGGGATTPAPDSSAPDGGADGKKTAQGGER